MIVKIDFYNDMINIKKLGSNSLKIDKKII